MYIPIEILETFSSIQKVAADRLVYYIGTQNTIAKGVKGLYAHLDKYQHILVGEPEIFDYLSKDRIIYMIFYKSLTKLEYLEYKYQEKVDNNGSDFV